MLSPKDLKDLFSESSPDRVILKAQRLAGKGRTDQAVEVIKEAVGRLGEHPDLRTEMATLLLAAGRSREAADALRSLLRADPSQVTRVEEYIGWARSQFSDVRPLYEALAEGHVARRNLNAAVDCLERIEKKALESTLEAKLANLRRFLEKGTSVPKSAIGTLYYAAAGYEALGDWQRAVDSYRKILSAQPGEMAAVDDRLKGLVGRNYRIGALRIQYAGILGEMGRHEESRGEYLNALEADPRSALEVAASIDRLLAAQPDDIDLLWARVRVQLAMGDTPEVLRMCSDLVDRGDRLGEVEKLLDDLAAAGKESIDTQLLLARVSMAQGKSGRAVAAAASALGNDAGARGIEALERIVKTFPQEPRPYQILAEHHLKEGRVDRCLETFAALRSVDSSSAPTIASRLQSVLMADPANRAAQDMLEDLSIELGDARGAAPFLRRRLREAPGEAPRVISILRNLLMACPAEESARIAAAEACLVTEEPAEAWSFLQDLVVSSRRPDPELLHLIVLCGGASPEAHRAVSSCVASSAADWLGCPEVVFALGEAAARAGLFREAIDRIREASAACPEGASVGKDLIRGLAGSAALDRGEDRAALAEALLDVDEQESALATLRGARSLPADLAASLVRRLTALVKRDPRSLTLCGALSEVYLATGQPDRALQIARAALTGREGPESAPLMMTYGDALTAGGKLGEATRAFASAARRDPAMENEAAIRLRRLVQADIGLETAHLALGRLLVGKGDLHEGVNELMTAWSIRADLAPHVARELERASHRFPGDPAVDFARAQLLLGTGDPRAAAECLGAHVGREPELLDTILTRLEAIISRHPDCARAHLELGRASLAKGWSSRACASLLHAYQIDPDLAEMVTTLLGEIRGAFPEEPEAHLALGALCEQQGRTIPAAESYLRAAQRGGAPGRRALGRLRDLRGPGGAPLEGGVAGRVSVLRARACRFLGDVGESVSASCEAIDAAPHLAPEVLSELEHLIVLAPGDASILMARARARVALQDLAGATADLSDALRADPARAGEIAGQARRILERAPSMTPAVLVLAEAHAAAGDVGEAAVVLDTALESVESRSDLELILARRRMALAAGDDHRARALLERANSAATDGDALLASLHREAMLAAAARGGAGSALGAAERGEFLRACGEVQRAEPSPLKAWVLDLSGRRVEAAACLRELTDPPAAARYAGLHDRMVGQELLGKAEAMVALVPLEFSIEGSSDDASNEPMAGRAAVGGNE